MTREEEGMIKWIMSLFKKSQPKLSLKERSDIITQTRSNPKYKHYTDSEIQELIRIKTETARLLKKTTPNPTNNLK